MPKPRPSTRMMLLKRTMTSLVSCPLRWFLSVLNFSQADKAHEDQDHDIDGGDKSDKTQSVEQDDAHNTDDGAKDDDKFGRLSTWFLCFHTEPFRSNR